MYLEGKLIEGLGLETDQGRDVASEMEKEIKRMRGHENTCAMLRH